MTAARQRPGELGLPIVEVLMRMRDRLLGLSLALCLAVPATLPGGGAPDLHKVPLPEGLVKTAEFSATVVCFLEGPAVDAQGNVFFSDIAGSRILKKLTSGKVVVFRADSGQTNGNAFDAQ